MRLCGSEHCLFQGQAVHSSPPADPAVITIAALVPRVPSSATIPGTFSGGVQMTAKSGLIGRDDTSGYARAPATAACLGLTGRIGPSNPAIRRFSAVTAPMECARVLAPIKAMDFGRKIESRLRTLTCSSEVPVRGEPYATLAATG